MIDFVRARDLSDLARRWLAEGINDEQLLYLLREAEPNATVFERRRIAARARQMRNIFNQVEQDDPPLRAFLFYPLPPSSGMEGPYLLETVWKVSLETDTGTKHRNLIVDVPNNSLWSTLLSELVDALLEMSQDYDAEDDPPIEFLLVR